MFLFDIMIRIPHLLVLALAAFTCSGVAAKPPPVVSGVWKPGHNFTEPRPKSSKYMKTIDAGFLVSGTQEAYRAEIQVSPKLAPPYFVRALFQNPLDPRKPFVEETLVSETMAQFSLTHGPVKGLQISRDYRITVEIFRQKGDAQALDVLVQSVRSYLDTTGPVTKLKSNLRAE